MVGMVIGKYHGLIALICIQVSVCDIYMHNPRGSNGRGCRNSNDPARSNSEGQRLFDTQNNANGGYSCPAAYPFACYEETDDAVRATCNEKNTGLSEEDAKAQVNPDGTLKHPDAVMTPRMYYHVGSQLPIEWTVQHGAGVSDKVHSEIVIQVACEDSRPGLFSFTDDCGSNDGKKICWPRDGTPVNNQDETNIQRIPEDPNFQDDYRYGRHESYRYYRRCRNLERNKGLFTADQKLSGNAATATRQNPNNARNGFECPEESEYYPWWQPSMWIDIAVVTSDMNKCERDIKQSQNVVDKMYCDCPQCTGGGNLPNHKEACLEKGGTWKAFRAWNKVYEGVKAPECILGAFSRDNHLGNVGGDGQPYSYNWTVPEFLKGKNSCVLRVRYNISSADFDSITRVGDSSLNGLQSPLVDRDENPSKVYTSMGDVCGSNNAECKLGLAINTNQYGRTFQDRSFTFRVRDVPEESNCANIYNLNVRGKRGNIVQVYPSVEYDFVPNRLDITEDDCVHVQWTGSDYNPNRQPNDAEGGPPNPNDINQAKADRSNIVELARERENHPKKGKLWMFADIDESLTRELAFLDQRLTDSRSCLSYAELSAIHGNDNNAIGRDWRNCMKLNGQKTPYFDAGLLHPREGVHRFMSTRNNNFSNRGMKGLMNVGPGTKRLSTLAITAITGFVVLTLGLLVFFGVPYARRWYARSLVPPPGGSTDLVSKVPLTHKETNKVVTALYDYTAADSTQLSFKAHDTITVVSTDASGWWTGRLESGAKGLFPSNFCTGGFSGTLNPE